MAYTGFQALAKQLAQRSGVQDPAALAATIGRKKYGPGAMQHAAASGHILREHGSAQQAYSDAVNRLTQGQTVKRARRNNT